MNKKVAIISGVIFALFAVSYFSFAKYQPKILKTLQEVKGAHSVSSDDLPYPNDAVKLSFFQTPKSKQTTYKTSKSPKETSDFYRNIYDTKNWRRERDEESESSVNLRYKHDDEVVEISGIKQPESEFTVVSINITEN